MKILNLIFVFVLLCGEFPLKGDMYKSSVRYLGAENSLITFSDDIEGIYINPVSSVYAYRIKSISLSYSKLNDTLNWFAITFGAGFVNTGIAGGFINYSASDIERISADGVVLGNTEYYQREYLFNCSYKFKKFLIGLNLKKNLYKFDYYKKNDFNIDIGTLIFITDKWKLSVVGKDLFNEKKRIIYGIGTFFNTRRPAKLDKALGIPVRDYDDELGSILGGNNNKSKLKRKNEFDIEADISHSLNDFIIDIASVGVEWWIIETIGLRSGMNYNLKYNGFSFAFGFTFIIKSIKLEYAYKNTELFGNHFFSAGIIF